MEMGLNGTVALRKWQLVALLAWPLICTVGAAAYGYRQIQTLRGDVVARPPLAIIDVNGAVMERIEKNPARGHEAAAQEVYAVGAKLAGAGYVVLNKSDLVAYPEEYEVKK